MPNKNYLADFCHLAYRAKEEKKKRRMHENMDVYKSQQISKLRERCKNQVRIGQNFS